MGEAQSKQQQQNKDASSSSTSNANDIAVRVAQASSTAHALEELGYAAAHTKSALKQILQLLPRIDSKGLAILLCTIAKTGDGSLTKSSVGDNESSAAAAAHTMTNTSKSNSNTNSALADLAQAMGLPAPTEAANRAKTWNIEAVADAVRETHPELDWRESVVVHLKDAIGSLFQKDQTAEMFTASFNIELSQDFESSLQQMNIQTVNNQSNVPAYYSFFSRLVEMYRRGAGSPFPAQAIVGDGIVWPLELQSTQMKLLSAAVFAVEPSLMEWEFGVTCFPPNGEKSESKRWSCVDLMLVLTKLAENNNANNTLQNKGGNNKGSGSGSSNNNNNNNENSMNNTNFSELKPIAAKVLDRGATSHADYVIAAISRAENAQSQIAADVVEKSLTRIFSNFQSSAPREYALSAAFTHLPDAVIEAMTNSYEAANACIPRIVDAISEMKNLAKVLHRIGQLASSTSSQEAAKRSGMLMGIEIAALASRREYLNLEKFLRDSLSGNGNGKNNNNSSSSSASSTNPDDFARACVAFLRRRCLESEGQACKGLNITSEAANLFFDCLEQTQQLISADTKNDIKTVKMLFAQRGSSAGDVNGAHGNDMNGNDSSSGNSGNANTSGSPGGASNGFPADIEAEANAHFQQVYAGQRKINDLVDMLGGFLRSNNAREREVFSCMVHNLFDEYRFFPKYPDKELRITAVLFGQLVQRQLVSNITLGVALRCVLDALRKPFGSKMFAFGSEALEQFKVRLPEWPQYCQHLAQIQHLRQAQPDLSQFFVNAVAEPTQVALGKFEPAMGGAEDARRLAAGVAGMKLSFNDITSAGNSAAAASAAAVAAAAAAAAATAASDQSAATSASATAEDAAASVLGFDSISSSKDGKMNSAPSFNLKDGDLSRSGSASAIASAPSGFATSLNLDTLLQASNQTTASPDAKTADQIHFAVNNLSGENCKLKGVEVKGKLKPEFYEWFATYMVVKRAAIEPNFHSLYLEMLDEIGEEGLFEAIIRATYHNIKVLLSTGKVKTNSGERSLLKNLGSWLGGLTIARLQPVLMIDLDVKGLIFDAYENGRMIAVIPFVAKILEPAKDNFVFKPPNPWTKALLALLAEIYLDRDLKLNLKFETERLFKHFDLSVKDVKPSNLLHNRQRIRIDNPDFVADKVPAGLSNLGPGGMLQSAASEGQLPASLQGQQARGGIGGWGQQITQQDLQQQQQQQQQNMASEQPSLSDAQALPNIQAHARVAQQPNVPESVRAMLARFLPIALTHGIREIVSPVVERSATIACVTSRELVRKDFACDPDTTRLRKAAHAMVSSLAGSLALATSREPLKASAANQLRLLVQRAGASNACEAQALENAIQNAVQDNLELGCALIEKAATEKALRDVDEALSPAVLVRRQHETTQQQQPSSISAPFYDSGVVLSGRYPAALQLETLRPPRPGNANLIGGVGGAQKVYDDFAKIPRTGPPVGAGGSATSSQSTLLTGGSAASGGAAGTQPTAAGSNAAQPPVPNSAFPGSQPPLPGAPPPQPPLPGAPPPLPPTDQGSTQSFSEGEDASAAVASSDVAGESNLSSSQKSAKEMRERVAGHFDDWARVQDLPPGDERSAAFLQRLESASFLREDAQEGFFRVLVELAVTHCLGSEKKNRQLGEESTMSFAAIDAYVRLVTRLARRSEETPQQRLALFGRALVAIVRTAMRDTDERGPLFNPKPYFRLLSGLLNEMRSPDSVLDSSHPQVLAAFASALLALQPNRVPGFAFAWLELVSHRCFMPRLLMDHAQKGRPLLQRLICAALKFLEPYLRECNLTDPVKLLYKGVLRIFLVLLHDFPEFLCENHVFFLDAAPTNCVQLRNLVLSAFPRNMRLPDPFTPNLKIDLLPEISQEPANATQIALNDATFNASNAKATIDNYLKNNSNALQAASKVRDEILLPGQKAMQTGTRYDVPIMNALVLYIGVKAIQANQNQRSSVLNSSPMELLQKLCDGLDAEGRYYFVNAIANQLRYPNSHTHYFSCVTLCLFSETQSEFVREQITRVLLERLVVNKPHPWGLLVSFIELIKNPRYNFWGHGFTRCAPEIERLFESVARSCVKPSSSSEQVSAGESNNVDDSSLSSLGGAVGAM